MWWNERENDDGGIFLKGEGVEDIFLAGPLKSARLINLDRVTSFIYLFFYSFFFYIKAGWKKNYGHLVKFWCREAFVKWGKFADWIIGDDG